MYVSPPIRQHYSYEVIGIGPQDFISQTLITAQDGLPYVGIYYGISTYSITGIVIETR